MQAGLASGYQDAAASGTLPQLSELMQHAAEFGEASGGGGGGGGRGGAEDSKHVFSPLSAAPPFFPAYNLECV